MKRENKAHTATVNRIARRYANGQIGEAGYDIRTSSMVVAVETSATLSAGLKALQLLPTNLAVYLAITNKEMVDYALRVARGSEVGVMDPSGNVIKPCSRQVNTPAVIAPAVAAPIAPAAVTMTHANEMAFAS